KLSKSPAPWRRRRADLRRLFQETMERSKARPSPGRWRRSDAFATGTKRRGGWPRSSRRKSPDEPSTDSAYRQANRRRGPADSKSTDRGARRNRDTASVRGKYTRRRGGVQIHQDRKCG